MSSDADYTGQAGLEFFGKVSASISHDIKNVLAVINENAGLLEDVCFMAEKGKPMDPSRLKRLALDVKEQVQRGDGIVTGLNRFAHSVDRASAEVDLVEILDLLAALALRPAGMRGVVLEVNRSSGPVKVATPAFALLNLLWLCLEHAMPFTGPARTIELVAEHAASGACLKLRKLEGLENTAAAAFPTEPAKALCRALRGQLSFDPPAKEISIQVPVSAGRAAGAGPLNSSPGEPP
jgi:signal transduction histidine kinase